MLTTLETVTVLATAISGESGVPLGNACEAVRNALQACVPDPDTGAEEISLEEALVAIMLYRIGTQPQSWRISRREVPMLARAAVDALEEVRWQRVRAARGDTP